MSTLRFVKIIQSILVDRMLVLKRVFEPILKRVSFNDS